MYVTLETPKMYVSKSSKMYVVHCLHPLIIPKYILELVKKKK